MATGATGSTMNRRRVVTGRHGGRRLLFWFGGVALLVAWVALVRRYWLSPGEPLSLLFFALYVLGTFLGWLNFGLWRRGPSYYPAGKLLAVATGLPGAFYTGLYLAYGFDRRRLGDDVARGHWGVILYALVVACELWAAYLLIRQNFFTRAGSAIDAVGGEHPPTIEQVEEALIVLHRAGPDRHGIVNQLAERWLRHDLNLRKLARQAAERKEQL